jgi:hypothetical protein
MDYRLRMNYSAFIDIDVGEWNGEKCLIIPMKKNDIYVRDRKIMQTFKVQQHISYQRRTSHFVREVWSTKHIAEMKERGFLRAPIVGNLEIETFKFKFDRLKPLNKDVDINKINENIDNALNK